jgi:hypothetical protein
MNLEENIDIETPQEDTQIQASVSESPQLELGKKYINPQTGQVIEWTGSEWRKVK